AHRRSGEERGSEPVHFVGLIPALVARMSEATCGTSLTNRTILPAYRFAHAGYESLSRPPHPHIKRALPAVADAGSLEADDQRAQLGAFKPERHLPLEDTALGERIAIVARALAGDDEHQPEAFALRRTQEKRKRVMRFALRHPMQVDPSVDRLAAARDLLLH